MKNLVPLVVIAAVLSSCDMFPEEEQVDLKMDYRHKQKKQPKDEEAPAVFAMDDDSAHKEKDVILAMEDEDQIKHDVN